LEVKSTTAVKLAELVYPEGHRSPDVFTDGETPYTHFKKFTGSHWSRSIVWARER
jgi:hypothetical protein